MLHSIEPLEARIAPATLVGRTLSYLDLDGDKVTITFTAGTYLETDFTFNTATFGDSGPQQLRSLNFSGDTDKSKTSITMKVTRVAGGDGQAHVGRVDATGVDLSTVSILGDLGRITAGDTDLTTAGVKALKVASMGIFGTDTQGGAGTVTSDVVGLLGSLEVKGHIFRAEFNAGSFGKITVGGSLTGGSDSYSGQLFSRGSIGDVTIKGDITGSSGLQSGQVNAAGKIGKILIGGSIIGASGQDAGDRFQGSGMIISGRTGIGDITSITVGGRVEGGTGFGSGSIVVGRSNPGTVGAIVIKGSLVGSDGDQSGSIWVNGAAKSLSIGGSIQALTGHYDDDGDGNGDAQGQVFIQGALGSLTVKGDLKGGSGHSSARVMTEGAISSVKIGGSLIAGSGNYSAMVLSEKSIGAVTIGLDIDGRLGGAGNHAGITAHDNLASVTVNGSMVTGELNAHDQLGAVTIKGSVYDSNIFGRGQMVQGATSDIAIKSIKIGGSIFRSQIIGGWDSFQIQPMDNGDAQIGAVTVGGDWVASDLISGIFKAGANYGDGDEVALTDNPNIFSRIASVTIKGTLLGTDSTISNSDHFGFEAQEIGAFSVGGQKIKLTAKFQDAAVTFSPITVDDVTLIEHAV